MKMRNPTILRSRSFVNADYSQTGGNCMTWHEKGSRALLIALFLVLLPIFSGCAHSAAQLNKEEIAPTMTQSVTPFLMFEGKAQEAMDFYVELIPNSRIVEVEKWGDSNPDASDLIMFATVNIGGQDVRMSDSPIEHAFTFTPSISLFVECESESEITRLSTALSEDGNVLMPLDSYEWGEKFAWVEDRFGVSWQLILR